jgi:hypothetical protein
MSDTQDFRPIPDPTALTTEASIRMEAMIRNLITSEIAHQNDLFSEKLTRVESQFSMLETRTSEQKSDMKAALDAALAAQKEGVASQTAFFKENVTKSETATTERIKGLETLLATSSKSTDDKIGDLKDRLIAIEAVKLGNVEGAEHVRSSANAIWGYFVGAAGIVLALVFHFVK